MIILFGNISNRLRMNDFDQFNSISFWAETITYLGTMSQSPQIDPLRSQGSFGRYAIAISAAESDNPQQIPSDISATNRIFETHIYDRRPKFVNASCRRHFSRDKAALPKWIRPRFLLIGHLNMSMLKLLFGDTGVLGPSSNEKTASPGVGMPYSWVKNLLLCEIFVVEGKMIVELSVNFRSCHSENTIGLSGQERSF
jgi:hypothetical protein